MYVRFVVSKIDEDSERRIGIFQAASDVRWSGVLEPHEEDYLLDLRAWFNVYLDRPTRFSATKGKVEGPKSRGLSWFKDSACEHIAKIFEMALILHEHGVVVEMLKAGRVGYVLYEDDYQVVAEPFADIAC